MHETRRNGGITRVLAITLGLLGACAVAAPPAFADPGDVGDASLWRTSPACSQPKDIVLTASGVGVLEFEYRVIGGEPTTDKSRPPAQDPFPHHILVALGERQVVWRAVARATDVTELPGGPPPADITAVDAFCGNDPIKEREER
jgi:hypothetical protein